MRLHGVTQRSIKAALEWALPPRPPSHWPLGWGGREAGKGGHCVQLYALLTLCQALPSLGAFLLLLGSASLEPAPLNQCRVVHLDRRVQRHRRAEEPAQGRTVGEWGDQHPDAGQLRSPGSYPPRPYPASWAAVGQSSVCWSGLRTGRGSAPPTAAGTLGTPGDGRRAKMTEKGR